MFDGKAEKLDIKTKINPDGFLKISPDGKFLAFRQMEKTSDSKQDSLGAVNLGEINVGIISLDELPTEPKFFQISSDRPTIRWNPTSDAFDFVENTSTSAIIKRQKIVTDFSAKGNCRSA